MSWWLREVMYLMPCHVLIIKLFIFPFLRRALLLEASLTLASRARFVLAVSELQFLGFIKPTKRKTDHVARLTWGGC